jgi:hypothetical protein
LPRFTNTTVIAKLSHRLFLGLIGVALIAALVIALLVLSGPPLGGISKNDAVKIAWHYAGTGGAVKLSTVRAGHFSEFRGSSFNGVTNDNHWVWAVSFSGKWSGSCTSPLIPGEDTCNHLANTSALVVLDYFSGDFLLEEIPSPIR